MFQNNILMNKSKIIIAVSIIVAFAFNLSVYGQERISYSPSIEVLLKGEEHFNNGEYDLAIKEFDKVWEGDSLFFRYAVYMKMNALNSMEEYQKTKDIGDKYWYFRHDLPTEFYLAYGAALDNLEEYDNAQKMYISILEEYPMNYSLWYNLGVSYSLSGNKEKAYETYKKTIEVNPFYDRVHLAMAGLAFEEQQTSKGLMAVGMYLITSATKRNNFMQLQYGDYMAKTKYWNDSGFAGSNNLDLDGNKMYSAIDQLVHNYVALQKKYKIPSKIDFPLIKQLYLIASQLKERKVDEDDYWYNIYGKYLVSLLDNGHFEGFTYLLANYVENESIQKRVSRGKKALNEAYQWSLKHLEEVGQEVDLSFMGYDKVNVIRGGRFYYIEILGDFEITNNGTNIVGDVKYFNSEGRKIAEGKFDSDGEKDGIWKYYHTNGRLKEVENITNGVITDTSYVYQTNGLLNFKVPYKNGEVEGLATIYRNGAIWRTIPFEKGDVGTGRLTDYHPIGTVDMTYTVENGKANGPFVSKYDSGQTYREGHFVDDELHGERLTYFKSGEISYKENFVNGKREGEYISYYRNGDIESKGQYKADNIVGTWEYFYRNGNKRSTHNFDDKGKENGLVIDYTEEGWKLSEHTYSSGVVNAYKFFDKEGNILSEGTRKGGSLDYKSYYDNGVLSGEGQFNRDGRHGEWKFYRYNGSLEKIENYKSGLKVGNYTTYYQNGNVDIKYNYDESGNSEGYYEEYYRTGNLYRQGFLRNDKKDGPWKDYYRNGSVYSSEFISAGNYQGFSTIYNIDKTPRHSEYYVDDLRIFTIYYDTAGVALDTIFDSPGKRTIELRRCAECPIYMKADLINNVYHGKQVFLYPDGTIESEGEMFNNRKHGVWKGYHLNGQLMYEGEYIDGRAHGEWKNYNDKGVMTRKSNYLYGDLHGEYQTFEDNGAIRFKANYYFDHIHGDAIYYLEGKQDLKRNYKHGYVNSITFLDSNGKEVTVETKDETVDIVTYWKNGNKAREYATKNGWFEGVYSKYYEDGQIKEQSTYENDLKTGDYKEWYKNGQQRVEAKYKDGELIGEYIIYYQSGKKQKVSNYVHGRLDGEQIEYNEDGSINRVVVYRNDNVISISKK